MPADPKQVEDLIARATPGAKTWGDGERCAECCNGDRCDDPDHYDRSKCPHCLSTGWALWSAIGATSYRNYRGVGDAS